MRDPGYMPIQQGHRRCLGYCLWAVTWNPGRAPLGLSCQPSSWTIQALNPELGPLVAPAVSLGQNHHWCYRHESHQKQVCRLMVAMYVSVSSRGAHQLSDYENERELLFHSSLIELIFDETQTIHHLAQPRWTLSPSASSLSR